MNDQICDAIAKKQIIKVIYNEAERIVEPYLLFETAKGKLILHSWQLEGSWEKTPPPDWCNMSLEKISSITPLDKFYKSPQPEYNPHSNRFYKIICHI